MTVLPIRVYMDPPVQMELRLDIYAICKILYKDAILLEIN